jgi:drug/metabolite transporter (DMT)-like permease
MAADEPRDIDVPGASLAVLVSIFWGANSVAIKIGLIDIPPLRLAAFRFVLGGLVILGWAWMTGRLAGFTIASHEWRPLGNLGLFLGVQVASLNIGTAMTSASHAAVLLNLYAVHIVVLAHFFIPGDRLTPRRLAGVLVAYAGIALLSARQASGGGATLAGDAVMFASGVLLAERTIYLARAVQHLDPVKMLLAQAAVGVVLFLVGSFVFEPAPTRWTVRLAATLGYQAVLITGFNFVVNLWLLRRYRPSALAPYLLTQPLFGVLAAAVFLAEPLTIDLLVASVAVAVGAGIASR